MMRLEGEKIDLRVWQLNDLERFVHWQSAEHLWTRFDGPYYPLLAGDDLRKTVDALRENILNQSFPTPYMRLVISDKHKEDQLIGIVSASWVSIETAWLDFGIAIFDEAYWSQGVGYEALTLWSDYLFAQYPHIVRLGLRTWSGNHGMMRLAEKLGHQLEARFRQARIVNGTYYDGLAYGILRSEWEARQR